MRHGKMGRLALAGVCLAALLLAAGGAPAYAHSFSVNQGSDYARVGGEHRWTEVCDMEQDGNGVYATYTGYGGHSQTVGDANGSAAGCGNFTASWDIVQIIICEDDWGGDTCAGRVHP